MLIVEDDRAIREPLSVLLRGEGYRVSLAENGQEALRKLRTEPSPDIIVLDLRMPVMDGWEFRAIQQQDPVLGLIPVVAISADGSAQAVTMSADAYLRKPLDPSDLLQTIEGILREQEWQAMSSRLEEAEHLASLGRVAAAVGHEINNPLAFVVLNLDQSLAQLRARSAGGDRPSTRVRPQTARDLPDRPRADPPHGGQSAAAVALRRRGPRSGRHRQGAGPGDRDGVEPDSPPRALRDQRRGDPADPGQRAARWSRCS